MLGTHPTQIKIAGGRAQVSEFFTTSPHDSNVQLLFGGTDTEAFPAARYQLVLDISSQSFQRL